MKNKFFVSLMAIGILVLAQAAALAGNWWDKYGEPEYGGTINFRTAALWTSFDPYNWNGASWNYWFEPLFTPDWTLDRDIWAFKTGFTPEQYYQGNLVESWENPDPETLILHIRKGVHWQNKPPLNGREFVADDVVFHFDRLMGTGHGYTKRTPYYAEATFASWKSVTAADDHTVVFKFKYPTAFGFLSVASSQASFMIEAPEAVEAEGGNLSDWRKAVGTGPWLITDFVEGSSLHYKRNPDYWGRDERYPDNQLPYAEDLNVLCITDDSTAIAALRTGKIDVTLGAELVFSQNLRRTTPEINQAEVPTPGMTLDFRVDREPFTDIRVRKALNMAIDRKAIAKSIFGGTVDGIPAGLVSPSITGWHFAYKDWPQELKDEYSYKPEQAKKLLAEAGYPNGFKTNTVAGSSGWNIQELEAIKANLLDIGVDMEIKLMDTGAMWAYVGARKHDQMVCAGAVGMAFDPSQIIMRRYSTQPNNFTMNNDAGYDAIVKKFNAAIDMEEARKTMVEADRYALEKHWAINTFPIFRYNIWQPSLKGYMGEDMGFSQGWALARLWKNKD